MKKRWGRKEGKGNKDFKNVRVCVGVGGGGGAGWSSGVGALKEVGAEPRYEL